MAERVRIEKKKRGGYRPGSGRPKGALAKATIETRTRVLQGGILPHEWLVKVSRGEIMTRQVRDKHGQKVLEEWTPTPEQQVEAAKAAAPFFQPKLVAQKISGDKNNPIPLSIDPAILKGQPEPVLQALELLIRSLVQTGSLQLEQHKEPEMIEDAEYEEIFN